VILAICLVASPVEAADIESLMDRAHAAREAGDFVLAEDTYREIVTEDPDNNDARLLLALVLGYQNKFDDALAAIAPAIAAEPQRDDLLLARARLHAWSGRRVYARADIERVLVRSPGNAEAIELSEWLIRTRPNGDQPFQLFASVSRSNFKRQSLERWYEARTALVYRPDGQWTFDGALQRSRRFGKLDNQLELGTRYRVDDRLGLGIRGEVTPDADFLAVWGGGVSADYRVWNGVGDWLGPGVGTLVARHRHYQETDIQTLTPRWTQYLGDGHVWVTAERIFTFDDDSDGTLLGWRLRADVSLEPVLPVQVFALRAAAPETDQGVTTDTNTMAGGMIFSATDRVDLRLDYARTDRSGSYIRNEWTLGTAVRF